MNKKMTIGALAVVALIGVGAVSAQYGGFGRAVNEYCTDDQTVGECKATIREARAQQKLDRCIENFDEVFCGELQALKQQHHNESAALLDEYGIEGRPEFKPERPEGPICSDDITVEECKQAHKDARAEARLEACTEAYGADFCEAWFALQEQHQEEVSALFDAYGYEQPDPKPGRGGHGGHGGPGGRGEGGEGRPGRGGGAPPA